MKARYIKIVVQLRHLSAQLVGQLVEALLYKSGGRGSIPVGVIVIFH